MTGRPFVSIARAAVGVRSACASSGARLLDAVPGGVQGLEAVHAVPTPHVRLGDPTVVSVPVTVARSTDCGSPEIVEDFLCRFSGEGGILVVDR